MEKILEALASGEIPDHAANIGSRVSWTHSETMRRVKAAGSKLRREGGQCPEPTIVVQTPGTAVFSSHGPDAAHLVVTLGTHVAQLAFNACLPRPRVRAERPRSRT